MLHNQKHRDLCGSHNSVAVVKLMTLQLVAYVTILGRQGILTKFPWGSILGEHSPWSPRVICHNGKL